MAYFIKSEYWRDADPSEMSGYALNIQSIATTFSFNTIEGDYTLTASDGLVIVITDAVITLPDPADVIGKSFVIKNASGVDIIVDGTTYDFGETTTLSDKDSMTVVSNGSIYYVI